MKSLNGITAWLEDEHGADLTEHNAEYVSHFGRDLGKAQSCSIFEQPGRQFTLHVHFGYPFRLSGADGVKVSIGIGHDAQEPSSMKDMQVWFIPGRLMSSSSKWKRTSLQHGAYKTSAFRTWDVLGRERGRSAFRIPHPDDNFDPETDEMVLRETFNANQGCIVVYINRVNLDQPGTDRDRESTEPPQKLRVADDGDSHVVCWDWCSPFTHEDQYPTVFNFCNRGVIAEESAVIDAGGHALDQEPTGEIAANGVSSRAHTSMYTGIEAPARGKPSSKAVVKNIAEKRRRIDRSPGISNEVARSGQLTQSDGYDEELPATDASPYKIEPLLPSALPDPTPGLRDLISTINDEKARRLKRQRQTSPEQALRDKKAEILDSPSASWQVQGGAASAPFPLRSSYSKSQHDSPLLLDSRPLSLRTSGSQSMSMRELEVQIEVEKAAEEEAAAKRRRLQLERQLAAMQNHGQ